jgi:hypothetical protein
MPRECALMRRGARIQNMVRDFEYVSDFGDDSRHLVMIVQVLQPQEDLSTWPMCPAGANACPPEDVGGTPRYMGLQHPCATLPTRNTAPCGCGGRRL